MMLKNHWTCLIFMFIFVKKKLEVGLNSCALFLKSAPKKLLKKAIPFCYQTFSDSTRRRTTGKITEKFL